MVSVCLGHKCLLQFTCPKCGQHTKLADVVEGMCGRCDASLSSAPTVSVEHDPVGLAVQALLQSWLLSAGDVEKQPELSSVDRQIDVQPFIDGVLSLLPELPKATVPVLYRLVYGLSKSAMVAMQTDRDWEYLHAGLVLRALDMKQLPSDDLEARVQVSDVQATEGNYRRRGPSESKGTSLSLAPSHSYVLYATATKGLCNWPQGFYDFLSAFRTVRNTRRGGAGGDGWAPATQNLGAQHEGRRTDELDGAEMSVAREDADSQARRMAEGAPKTSCCTSTALTGSR